MVMVCIHSGMAAVGVMRPERTSEGNSRDEACYNRLLQCLRPGGNHERQPHDAGRKEEHDAKEQSKRPRKKESSNHQRQTAKIMAL